MKQPRRFYHSIRFKLLLVSLTLLLIPWAGYRFIQETEHFLRQSQEEMLLGTAQAIAAILHNQPGVLNSAWGSGRPSDNRASLYINPVRQPIQLDGYLDEWQPHLQNRRAYPNEQTTHFYTLALENEDYLYLLIQVNDQQIIYQEPGQGKLNRSDSIELAIESAHGRVKHYRITTTSPGWINAQQTTATDQPEPLRTEARIQGEWQETADGYQVELRIPDYLLASRIGLSVINVDDPLTRQVQTRTAISGMDQADELARLIRPDPAIEKIIGDLQHQDARIWVLNRHQQVLAQRGQLSSDKKAADEGNNSGALSYLRPLYRLMLPQPREDFQDSFNGRSRLTGKEIDAALSGKPATLRRATPDNLAVILSATWPINSPQGVIGAVLVEQSTNQILSLQNEALEQLFAITLTFFLCTSLGLLGFASLLTGRIRQLRNRVEMAITKEGRITGVLPPTSSPDEIGDLGRSFSGVLDRLAEYNHYLEAMASRLAHELQTPLSIVQSSLEIMQHDPTASGNSRYLDRALNGVGRLTRILQRMREATRLEQLLQQAELERFDLASLVSHAMDSYQLAFPEVIFECVAPQQPVMVDAAAELISQALDKLITNAVDFHYQGSPVICRLQREANHTIRLSVCNQGPPLPEGMQQQLFSSMISLRSDGSNEPHLGLGLYLARLICEFHGGSTEAHNLPDDTGVEFSLILPASSIQQASSRSQF